MNISILAVLLGTLLTGFAAPDPDQRKEHAMSQYMLILHESPTEFADMSADELHRVVLEYVAWKESIQRDGRYVGSNKLADEGGRRLTSSNGVVRVTDGPYAEAREVVGGYFIITASDYDDAVAIAKTCPHLKYGGTIELRCVENVGEAAGAGQ